MELNTRIQKALQWKLLLVQDNTKIIVLFAAAAASGAFRKTMELYKGCVAFLFQAIWEMKSWVIGADFVYTMLIVKIAILTACLKSSKWITQQKSQTAMPAWNTPHFSASMHCENWLQNFNFWKLYTSLFIGRYWSQKCVWIIFWHQKLRKIQNTHSDVFQCPKEKKLSSLSGQAILLLTHTLP